MLFLYGGYVRTYLRELKAAEFPIMSELPYVLDANGELQAPESHRQLCHALFCRASQPLGHDPSIKNRLVLAV